MLPPPFNVWHSALWHLALKKISHPLHIGTDGNSILIIFLSIFYLYVMPEAI